MAIITQSAGRNSPPRVWTPMTLPPSTTTWRALVDRRSFNPLSTKARPNPASYSSKRLALGNSTSNEPRGPSNPSRNTLAAVRKLAVCQGSLRALTTTGPQSPSIAPGVWRVSLNQAVRGRSVAGKGLQRSWLRPRAIAHLSRQPSQWAFKKAGAK